MPKALALIAVATAAQYISTFVSAFVAFGIQIALPQIVPGAGRWSMGNVGPASPTELLVGGLVGGFLLFGAVMLLSPPELGQRSVARRTLLGTILGGLLGVAGWALASSVGTATWYLLHFLRLTSPWEWSPHAESTRMYSVYVVWQTVVAIGVGIMLRHVSVRGNDEPNNTHLSF